MTRTLTFIFAASVAVGMALVPSVSRSQGIELLDTLNPDLSGEEEQIVNPGPMFGWSLAADGGTLLVGMPHFVDSNAVKSGIVDEFERSGDAWQWTSRESLQNMSNSDHGNGHCGFSVARAAWDESRYQDHRGCPSSDINDLVDNGYVRLLDAPSEAGSITGLYGPSHNDNLGLSIDAAFMSDGTAVAAIGAPGGDYVQILKEIAPPVVELLGTAGEEFGHSVAIAAGGTNNAPIWLAVGAPQHANAQGIVYVYYYNRSNETWVQSAQITLADGQPDDEFGHRVAFHTGDSLLDPTDDLLVVSALNRNTRGTVSVFRNDGLGNFSLEGDVLLNFGVCGSPSNCDQPMQFGHAVAIDDQQRIWVGAPLFEQDGASDVGRVYMASWGPFFSQPEAWHARSILTPGALSDDCGLFGSGQPGGLFGASLATVERGIAVGYPRRGCQTNTIPSQVGSRTGQVRIYGIRDGLFADRFE